LIPKGRRIYARLAVLHLPVVLPPTTGLGLAPAEPGFLRCERAESLVVVSAIARGSAIAGKIPATRREQNVMENHLASENNRA